MPHIRTHRTIHNRMVGRHRQTRPPTPALHTNRPQLPARLRLPLLHHIRRLRLASRRESPTQQQRTRRTMRPHLHLRARLPMRSMRTRQQDRLAQTTTTSQTRPQSHNTPRTRHTNQIPTTPTTPTTNTTTRTLLMPQHQTPQAWRAIAADTVVTLAQIRWTLGDLINQAPDTPALAELLNSNDTLEPGETSLMAATAQAFPPHRRRPNLPWNVHAATVALPARTSRPNTRRRRRTTNKPTISAPRRNLRSKTRHKLG